MAGGAKGGPSKLQWLRGMMIVAAARRRDGCDSGGRNGGGGLHTGSERMGVAATEGGDGITSRQGVLGLELGRDGEGAGIEKG